MADSSTKSCSKKKASSSHAFSGAPEKIILKVAVPSPLRNLFDYLLPESVKASEAKQSREQVDFGAGVIASFEKRENTSASSPHAFSGDPAYLSSSSGRAAGSSKKVKIGTRVLIPFEKRENTFASSPHAFSGDPAYLSSSSGRAAGSSKKVKIGTRVLIPFGKREVIGVVLEVTASSKVDASKLKPAIEILDDDPILSSKMIELIYWISDYYHHPIGDVVANVLPALLRKKSSTRKSKEFLPEIKNYDQKKDIVLNEDQEKAISEIKKSLNKFKAFLLDGVTGSGKTEVYLQVIAEIIAQEKQALVLVPEINLTPQTISRFAARFPVKIAVFHSGLTPKQRLLSWQMARSGEASIIIGTRSAIFTPLKNPGIIIIDEEHDLSFKQQSGLKYSARDIAMVRGKLENIPVVLGSATPSLESIFNVKRKRYTELSLPKRAGGAIFPEFFVVDMRNQKLKEGLSENLIHKIKEHLEKEGQVLVFLNRRGFAPVLICNSCSWNASCKYCDARMTYHKKKNHLRCHHCGMVVRVPEKCPECEKEKLFMLGVGTERVEEVLKEVFPETKITRVDRDTTRAKDSLEKMFEEVHKGEPQILIGTQMLAKGHHFPKVTMSAVLNVDQSLLGADFRSEEHLAQLVVQVAGRAGREERPGEVYLQTHNPHHPLLLSLVNGGYKDFVQNALAERNATGLPPYSYLALLQAEAKVQERVFDFLNNVNERVKIKIPGGIKILGPVPTAMERKAGYFRAQLLLQSKNRKRLQEILGDLLEIIDEIKPHSTIRWFLDVDPLDLS